MTVYVDMDGVLARWNTDATLEDTLQKGYFAEREPEIKMVQFVKALRKLGVHVCILSAAYQNGYAAAEKSDWLDRFFDKTLDRIFVPYGESKSDYIASNQDSILIDDYSENLRQWAASGSKAIKFYNGINGTKGTWNGKSINLAMSIGEMIESLTQNEKDRKICPFCVNKFYTQREMCYNIYS